MKENSCTKVRIASEGFRIAKTALRLIGGALLVCAVALTSKGLQLSQNDAMMVEAINKLLLDEADLYPATGIVYELEARIIDEEASNPWYHGAITANYGDTIEVRLKAIAADAAAANREAIDEHLSFASTKGLTPSVFDVGHNNVTLPDDTLADYLDEFADDHITYIAVGRYILRHEDFWSDQRVSALSACVSGDTVAKLVIVPPDCEVDIRAITVLAVLALLLGVILPVVLGVAGDKVVEYLGNNSV